MEREGLLGLLGSWLELEGFETRFDELLEGKDGGAHDIPILATKPDMSIIVFPTMHTVTKEELASIEKTRETVGATKSWILQLTQSNATSRQGQSEVWNSSQLAVMIGMAALRPYIASKQGNVAPIPESPKAVKQDAPERVLSILLSAGQAKKSWSFNKLACPEPTLVLSPCWIFEFEVDLFIDGSLKHKTVRKIAAVDGISQQVRAIEQLPTVGGTAPPTARIRKSGMTEEEATKRLREQIRLEFSKVVDIETIDEEDDSVSVEKRRVLPAMDQIRLICQGQFHWPEWHMESGASVVIVDATFGAIIKN